MIRAPNLKGALVHYGGVTSVALLLVGMRDLLKFESILGLRAIVLEECPLQQPTQ